MNPKDIAVLIAALAVVSNLTIHLTVAGIPFTFPAGVIPFALTYAAVAAVTVAVWRAGRRSGWHRYYRTSTA